MFSLATESKYSLFTKAVGIDLFRGIFTLIKKAHTMEGWKPTSHTVKFTVVFTGSSTDDHTINAADLAVSLSGISGLLFDANHKLNGPKSSVTVKVYGSPKAGSFEFDIITTIAGPVLIGLINTVDIIGLAGDKLESAINCITNLIDLIKATNGKPIETVRTIDDDHVEISVSNSQNTIIVNNSVIQLYKDPSCRREMERVVTPLFRQGVESVTFKNSESVPEVVTCDQAVAFVAPEPEPICAESNVASFVITRADFSGRPTGWRFSLNTDKGADDFPVEILDSEFLENVLEKRIRVSQGTVIRAKYEMVQERKERIVTRWRIHRILEITPELLSEVDTSLDEWGITSERP